MDNQTPYDRDFYAWANEQADLLRAGRLSEADIEHIAEEIESLGKSEKRELVSRLAIVLLHLLKWQFQPSRRGASWEASIANNRDQLAVHLDDNPSLKALIPNALIEAYRYALRDAVAETGLKKTGFPQTCPWDYEQIMDPDFWPEAA
jgi:hypothetical protein